MSRGSRNRYTPGQWQIERERCQIEAYKPPSPSCDGVNIATGVKGIMKALGLENESWTTCLVEEWPSLVGKQVSQHTRPGKFQKGELIIYVDSSVWFSELQRFGLKTILKNIQARFGDQIRNVRLQLNPNGVDFP